MGITINGLSTTASIISNPSASTKEAKAHIVEPQHHKELVNGANSAQRAADVGAAVFHGKSRAASYGEEKSVDASFESEENKESSKEKKEEDKGKKGTLNVKA